MRNLKLWKWWKVKNIIIVIWSVNIIKNTNNNRILNLINRMLNFTTNMDDKMTLGMYLVTFGTVISSTNCNLIPYLFYILSLCMYLI
jgi:hypothetical protein